MIARCSQTIRFDDSDWTASNDPVSYTPKFYTHSVKSGIDWERVHWRWLRKQLEREAARYREPIRSLPPRQPPRSLGTRSQCETHSRRSVRELQIKSWV